MFFKKIFKKNYNLIKNNNIYFNKKIQYVTITKKKKMYFFVKWDKNYKNYELIQKFY